MKQAFLHQCLFSTQPGSYPLPACPLPAAKQMAWPARLAKGVIPNWLPALLLLVTLVSGAVQAGAQTSNCTTLNFAAVANYSTGCGPQSVITGDFNKDGKLDLATANEAAANISVLLGNGAGGFGVATSFGTVNRPYAITTGDFNRDGNPDLVTANMGNRSVSLFVGDGAGGFRLSGSFVVDHFARSITTGDYNGDGKPDIATVNFGSPNVYVLLGDGGGGFADRKLYFAAAGGDPLSITTGDFNKDGKSDIAATNYTGFNVAVLLANNTGGFAPDTTFSTGISPYSIITADLNKDGNPDLVTANRNGFNSVSVLLGNGTGGFAAPANFNTATSNISVAAGDFNGDGKLDLVTANDDLNNISVLLGNGTGGFAAPASFGVGMFPQYVTAGDFNGDGKADLATANLTSANVSVLLSDCRIAKPAVTASGPTTFCAGNGNNVVLSAPAGFATYAWSNGATTRTITVTTSGSYTVTVTNAAGVSSFPSDPVIVTVNALPATPTISVTQPVCGVTGNITVNAPAGTGITYSINGTAYQAGNVFNNVASGNYNVTARSSSGCISAAAPVTINTTPATPAKPSVTIKQPDCIAVGTITIDNASGSGTTYSINGTAYQASNVFMNVAPGNYNVTAKSSDGCVSAATAVTINAQPPTAATPTVTVTQSTCTVSTGTITVNTPVGEGFSYSINGTVYQTSNVFNNVAPGNYNVTALSRFECVSAATPVTVNAVPTAPAAPTVSVTQPTCSVATGTITVTAPTGTGFTYSFFANIYQSSPTFNNVDPGSYSIRVKNSSGCISAATPVTINAQPADNQPPVIPASLTVFLNANGQASVTSASIAPLITDNCAVDPNSITVTANSFSCTNITGATTFQPFVANNATGNQNAVGEQGMDFRVNAASSIVVTQLGAFDHQSNGLTGTQPDGNGNFGIRVAIFRKSNQTIVPGLDVVIVGSGDAFTGNYRYKNIPAVTLPPGDYLVVAKGYNANELSGNSYLGGGPYPQGSNAGGAISYLNNAYYDENDAVPGFSYPPSLVNTGTSNIFKGGTFTYALPVSNTVIIKAADFSGNQSQVTANVMVMDTMYTLTAKDITVTLNSSGQATIQPKDVLQSFKNKCGINVTGSTLQVSPSSFNCSNVGNATLSSPYQPFIAINATGNQNATGEQGMDFRVNATSGIVITQLGAFDHQANGLNGTQPDGNGGMGIRVAIFNKANQSIVPGLDVVITGNGDAFSGNYRYKNIPAVTLPPGDYVVLAKGYNANELSGNSYLGGGPYPQGDNASGAITYLNTAYYDENDAVPGFTYPSVSVNTGTSSVLKSGTFTYKTKMASGTLVTLTAMDVYGNQKRATANVTVTDFNHVCTPAAKAAPVMAAAISTKQPKELVEVEKVSAYPNPSNGVFNVLLSGYSVPKLSLEILDGNGKVIALKAITPDSKTGVLTVAFDLGSKASGMYWIRAVSASGIQTAKVLLQR